MALINTNSFSKMKLFTSSVRSLTILLEYNFPFRLLNFLLKKSILKSKFSIDEIDISDSIVYLGVFNREHPYQDIIKPLEAKGCKKIIIKT